MKVFFTASQRGKEKFGQYYKIITDEITNLGYKLLEDDISKLGTEQFYKTMKESGRKANIGFYQNKIKHIHDADIVVFECSEHSLSIGFVIEKALEFNKPTVVLYLKDHEPFFLEGSDDEKLILCQYTEKSIKKVIKGAITLARERRDKRFNFFISPKLLDYLEEASNELAITKSTFIRNLIMDHKKRSEMKLS